MVSEATEKVVKNDEMREHCFARTCSLLQCKDSESNNLINPQQLKSKIIMPNLYVEDEEKVEFIAPSSAITPQEENMGNEAIWIVEDSIDDVANDMNALIACKDENEADHNLYYEDLWKIPVLLNLPMSSTFSVNLLAS